MEGRYDMPGEDLNGARGKIFHVNLENQSFELLKETAIDPRTNEGKSRHTLIWTDTARIIQAHEQNNFAGITTPRLARFKKLDEENAQAAASGKPFIVMEAQLLAENERLDDWKDHAQYIVGMFTADPTSPNLREGTVALNGKNVPVKLRGPRAKVFVHAPASAQEVSVGFWEAQVFGTWKQDQFIVDKMIMSPVPDPRKTDDPTLPRVLVIGDSISMNYHSAAKRALEGIANYHRIEGNAGSVDRGVLCTELWLGDYEQEGLHWDLIQFNHGLHDLKQVFDKDTQTYGEYNIPIAQYKKYLEQQIEILKKTGAKLIWCTTTPVPNNGNVWGTPPMGRQKDADLVFNQAAQEVIDRHPEIFVNDLNAVIRDNPAFDTWRTGTDVHFWGNPEAEIVGKAVADAIKKALSTDK
jgi:acyl-CoA thioesterase-1